MAEEVYGTDFPERVLTAIVRRLDISWVLPPAPELHDACTAIDVTAALADVVRSAKAFGGEAFDCPFDFHGAPRAFTAAEIADVLIDLAMRMHRFAGDDHASEPYDTLRTRPCLRPYIVRAFAEFCHRCDASREQVIAFVEATGMRVGNPSMGTLRRPEAPQLQVGAVPVHVLGGLWVGSEAQPDILVEFMASHRFEPPTVIAIVAYLQDRIERVGRPLDDEEFRTALGEFMLQANMGRSGPMPSA